MNSNTFTPDKGTLFYVSSRIYFRIPSGGLFEAISGDTGTAEKVRDRSWEDRIFRAVAFDDRAVVGDMVHGHVYGSARMMLLRINYDFIPVGPDVAIANCKTPDACQVTEALPPLYLWLRREMRAAMQIPRWYSSFRNNGFSRRRSVFLAWRTTRPIRINRK